MAEFLGMAGIASCDLRFTQILPTAPTCLLNFQGADILLEDLSTSTNNTALMLQEYYTWAVNFFFKFQTSNGPCPVGPDGFPSGVPMGKRATAVETALLAVFSVITNLTLNSVAALAGPNCDFSLVDPNGPEVTGARALLASIVSQDDQCIEDLDGDCTPGDGCTQTQGFWKNHFPWPGTNTEDNLLCGVSWTDWLLLRRKSLPQFGNAQRILGRQWIAAELNELNGACIPAEIDLDAAEQILNDNCGNIIHPSNYPTGQNMINLASDIGELNEGLVGPGSCV